MARCGSIGGDPCCTWLATTTLTASLTGPLFAVYTYYAHVSIELCGRRYFRVDVTLDVYHTTSSEFDIPLGALETNPFYFVTVRGFCIFVFLSMHHAQRERVMHMIGTWYSIGEILRDRRRHFLFFPPLGAFYWLPGTSFLCAPQGGRSALGYVSERVTHGV